jgi:hypothetical protein
MNPCFLQISGDSEAFEIVTNASCRPMWTDQFLGTLNGATR